MSTLKKTEINNLIIGVSGGIDSATSLYLAARSVAPENIYVAHLYYFQPLTPIIKRVCSELKIPKKNQYLISIKKPVDELMKLLGINNHLVHDRMRGGNVMARVRMITLFDLAKKHQALVLGTENKSEHLLGYFTRFGDAASDIEPICHLYKTEVYELARYLKVPEEILNAKPTAGLWDNQTDEGEFGFSYQEADQVLHQYFDKKIPLEKINKSAFPNADKIVNFALKNSFKLKVPYTI